MEGQMNSLFTHGNEAFRKKTASPFLPKLSSRPTKLAERNAVEMGKSLFELKNICVSYGKNSALRDVNLSIKKGEILFVTGKSGAGKTTLLGLLAREIDPTSGSLVRRANMFCSQVFQDLMLLEERTLEENLWCSYDTEIYSKKNEFYADLLELSQILGVKNFLAHKVKNVNRGMKQKVCLMRALLSRPDVLLADEPTSALDKENSSKLFDLLNFYNLKRGLTVIWATHNRDLVKQFPGEIIHLESGKLIYSGKACFI